MASMWKLSFWRMAGVAVAAVLIVSACATSAPLRTSSAKQIVTFAEQPNAAPNYIAPLMPAPYFNFENGQFIPLLYPPLYTFGTGGAPTLNKSLSIAYPPVFSANDTIATVTMKHWHWSDGQPVTARDVTFWMNLLSAVTDPNAPAIGSSAKPGPGWGAFAPGYFPENVVSYSATGPYTVVFKLNQSYNPTWFLYNELSQVTPMPQQAWDKLSSTGTVGNYDTSAQTRKSIPNTSPLQYIPADEGTASSGALGVAQFLNSQSQDLGTYPSNPLWQVIDGPFRLSQFTTSGFVKLVPNRRYSGSPKASIGAFEELPFTSSTAEFDSLHSGSLTIGYIPPEDLSAKASLEHDRGYSYSPWNISGLNYIAYNFTNPTYGPILRQLYFRQALQYLINQPQYIKDFLDGVGTMGNGPVPAYPPSSPFLSPLLRHAQIYPYNPAKAATLLGENGWTVNPGGVTVCSKAGTALGDCGAGIKAGEAATFPFLYSSGSSALSGMAETLASTAKLKAGITLVLAEATLGQLSNETYGGCTPSTPCTDWALSLASTSASWTFSPDYLPTGGEPFACGSSSNIADYCNPTNQANITATHTAASADAEISALFRYEDYLARQLPRAWMPMAPASLTMYKSSLQGVVPQNVFQKLQPQYYSFKS